MNKLTTAEYIWIWTKGYVMYKATLHGSTFIVRDIVQNNIILKIKNLTPTSQKRIIKSMHTIKKTGVMKYG